MDDDRQIREVLVIALERAGYTVIAAADGQSALRMAARDVPDLIVLDVGLPEVDGLEVCRRIRANSDVPILFLTARDDEVDRILGLELGADDYVTKPFSPRELLARIKAILKRSRGVSAIALTQGVVFLHPQRHLCTVAGRAVALTATEFAMLARLMLLPQAICSRAHLTAAIWGANTQVADRTLDSHLRNLRHKLHLAGLPDAVQTIHGVGIRMGACNLA